MFQLNDWVFQKDGFPLAVQKSRLQNLIPSTTSIHLTVPLTGFPGFMEFYPVYAQLIIGQRWKRTPMRMLSILLYAVPYFLIPYYPNSGHFSSPEPDLPFLCLGSPVLSELQFLMLQFEKCRQAEFQGEYKANFMCLPLLKD